MTMISVGATRRRGVVASTAAPSFPVAMGGGAGAGVRGSVAVGTRVVEVRVALSAVAFAVSLELKNVGSSCARTVTHVG